MNLKKNKQTDEYLDEHFVFLKLLNDYLLLMMFEIVLTIQQQFYHLTIVKSKEMLFFFQS